MKHAKEIRFILCLLHLGLFLNLSNAKTIVPCGNDTLSLIREDSLTYIEKDDIILIPEGKKVYIKVPNTFRETKDWPSISIVEFGEGSYHYYQANLPILYVKAKFSIQALKVDLRNDRVNDNNSIEITVNHYFKSVLWSTGDTSLKLEINQEGTYWVKAIDNCGRIYCDTLNVVTQTNEFYAGKKNDDVFYSGVVLDTIKAISYSAVGDDRFSEKIDFSYDTADDIQFDYSNEYSPSHGNVNFNITPLQFTEVATWENYAINFNPGEMMGKNIEWSNSPTTLYQSNSFMGGIHETSGNFDSYKESYLCFRIKIGDFIRLGWVRVILQYNQMIIKDYAIMKDSLLNNISSSTLSTNIYPNPAKNIINIDIKQKIKKIELFDLWGRKLIDNNVVDNSMTGRNTINVETIPDGTYVLSIYLKDDSKLNRKIYVRK